MLDKVPKIIILLLANILDLHDVQRMHWCCRTVRDYLDEGIWLDRIEKYNQGKLPPNYAHFIHFHTREVVLRHFMYIKGNWDPLLKDLLNCFSMFPLFINTDGLTRVRKEITITTEESLPTWHDRYLIWKFNHMPEHSESYIISASVVIARNVEGVFKTFENYHSNYPKHLREKFNHKYHWFNIPSMCSCFRSGRIKALKLPDEVFQFMNHLSEKKKLEHSIRKNE